MRFRFPLIVFFALAFPVASNAAKPDPVLLAERIDERLEASWAKAGVKPAAMTDDAAFARRVYLDLVGRIPTVAESRSFLAESSPDKRAKLVDDLLASGGHSRHAATFWRRVWIPQADTPRLARLSDGFEEWLAAQLTERVPYDELVRIMMTAKRSPSAGRRPRNVPADSAIQAFVTASESKPENLAANTARAFLGVNLDCAQCHDHPFAKWTRDQFWETAAFFAPPATADGKTLRPEMAIPNTKRKVAAEFLIGAPSKWPDQVTAETGSQLLANWVTAPENPLFAKNAVNRVWAELFGTGLAEPLDDLGGESSPSHPELLDDLAKAFIESGYDLNYLTKALVLTKAYQLSSGTPVGVSPDTHARLFLRMPVRGLTGEQLYDSLRVASGLPVDRDDLDPVNALRERKLFASRFYTQRAATTQRSIVQSLSLMNGSATAAVTDSAKTPILSATAQAPFLDTAGKVESLFLAALGRKPTAKELASLVKYVESGGSSKKPDQALADVFWALLNGSEFSTNH